MIALLNLRIIDISQQWQFSILSSLRNVLNHKRSGPKNVPQIFLKERTAHLASYTSLQEMLINIKTSHFHSSINQQECLFHRTLIISYFLPVNIAKLLRTAFLYSTSRRSCLQMFFKIGVLEGFRNFIVNHLCWSVFLKNRQALGLNKEKKTPTHVLSCELCKIFKNTFFYRTPLVTASAPLVAASGFFQKSH